MSGKSEDRTLLDRIEQARSIVRLVVLLIERGAIDMAKHDDALRNALVAADVLLDDAGDLVMDEAEKPAQVQQ
jgi:hypothetical protein